MFNNDFFKLNIRKFYVTSNVKTVHRSTFVVLFQSLVG